MRRLLPTLFVLVLLPNLAMAQKRTIHVSYSRGEYYGNRFSLEPYAGALKDPYDIAADNSNTSALLGFRVGYRLGGRTRLLGNIGYTETQTDNTWVFTTGGAEFDVVPGRTSASLGLQAGAGWRSTQQDRDFHASTVIIPSLAVRHRFTSRIGAFAALHDNIYVDGPALHGVGVSAGLAFR